MQYFYINNVKFNYRLEFQSNAIEDYWKSNAPLIEYCESVGVDIPHYCYNKSLSISGNCRMCLVELENAPKPIVSCAMSAKSCLNNSKVYTNSPLVKKARENILEFLLLNHPLDCPICDQGGECDLQDQSLFFGVSKKRFYNFKRTVIDKNIGTIVKTVMTRCIHCTRCVRFASEIAGVEDLGMFGRGLKSEIGNYVNKTFHSEISGNVIDLCPVGALTSKPYPFKNRSWELKNIMSFDCSDSLASNTQVSIKNNKIVKVLPDFNKSYGHENWISDKTRFSFDGMFSSDRLLGGLISTKHYGDVSAQWVRLFEELIQYVYFKDHINKHVFEFKKLVIVIDGNSSLEVVNFLILLSKQYSFIQLRRSEDGLTQVDFQSDFLLNAEDIDLNSSKTCLLININSRYETSSFNLRLRSRYAKGNFKVYSIGSAADLTFPVRQLGLNLKSFKSIVEGNHPFCRKLLEKMSNPMIVTNIKFYKNNNSSELINIINSLNSQLKKYHFKWDNFNVVGSTTNESGLNFLGNFPVLTELDVQNSFGMYFLNNHKYNNFNIEKLIAIRSLSYLSKISSNFLNNFDNLNKNSNFVVDQNGGLLSKSENIYYENIYYNFPNTIFYESPGSIMDATGKIKHQYSVLPSSIKSSKLDLDIFKKVFYYLTHINYLSYFKDNNKIFFNNISNYLFEKYVGGLYWPCRNFEFSFQTYANYLEYESSLPKIMPKVFYKNKKTKVVLNNSRLWLNDFYISGKDLHSSRSIVMLTASLELRRKETNFIDL